MNKNTPLINNEKILVVVAHADDEAIGCGGTLLKHQHNGDEVVIIYMTDGVGARTENARSEGSIAKKQRLSAQLQACQKLNISKFYNFDFPDNRMDQVPLIDIVQVIEPISDEYKPTIVYTHHGGDLSVDHRIVHQAVMTAFRPLPNRKVPAIYSFEVNSSTEWNTPNSNNSFTPNCFVDISAQIESKVELLKYYQTEMPSFPHARSIESITALATVRGCSIGVSHAEAFMLIRELK